MNAKLKITVSRLKHAEQCGDWHDKPLKWTASGPGTEVQKFSTRKDAEHYAKLRRHLTESESHSAFALS